MSEKLQNRQDVSQGLTWDLSSIYTSEKDFYKDMEKLKTLAEDIEKKYKSHLDTAANIDACITEYQAFLEIETLVYHYADLAVSVDYYDSHNQERLGKVERLVSSLHASLSFIESEIMEQNEDVLKEAIAYHNGNSHYLADLLANKPHQLNKETEKVLAALNPTLNAAYETYNVTKLADMQFDDFTVDGVSYPLGYSLFEDNYEYDPRTNVRRGAFEAFSKKIRQYENVTATAYNHQVQYEKTMSELRGFSSIFDYLLINQKVSLELYNRQIDLIMEHLAPHMRKYAHLLQKVHHLDKITFADLKLPVDPEYSPSISIKESKEYIEKGLSILGSDYVDMIQTAYKDRWVDFAQNKGKSTGGFCASPYGKNSFILLSWNNKMSDVFTLAHELGHAGHFKACNHAQSILDTDVSTYFVECPSTMNELLMGHYLLKTNDDPRFKRWVLSSMIGNTYYHNFVTHLLEAAYQREVYRIIDQGGSVSANVLNQLFKDTLTKFWGDSVELTEGAELTWMRQPHYYMGLYSYTYSAGLTIATQVCKRIESEPEKAIDDWKKVLAAGSTLTPVELAALAGIDITTDAALLDTIDTIGQMIDDICTLTDQL